MAITAYKKRELELFTKFRTLIHARYEAYWNGESNGYCPHNIYVGGCGPDYMCGYCEAREISITEEAFYAVRNELRTMQRKAINEIAEQFLDSLTERVEDISPKTVTELAKLYAEMRNLL